MRDFAAAFKRVTRQAIRYLGVAGFMALFYLGVYTGLVLLGLHYLLAILFAQIVAISVAFPLYRTFVFASQGRVLADFLRFLSVWTGGALIGVALTPALVELAGWNPIVAQVVAVVAVSVGSFLAHRFFSFKARPAATPPAAPERAEGGRR